MNAKVVFTEEKLLDTIFVPKEIKLCILYNHNEFDVLGDNKELENHILAELSKCTPVLKSNHYYFEDMCIRIKLLKEGKYHYKYGIYEQVSKCVDVPNYQTGINILKDIFKQS